jgi:tRNA pseudouridine55 synthase
MSDHFEGFLLIDKPEGITSYDVIRHIKKCIPKNKIGHSGTLDPFATGLMIIAIGKKYTKQLNTLLGLDKQYRALITLGKITDSYDIDGKTTYTHPSSISIDQTTICNTLEEFKGTTMQQAPNFSAKKINGTPAYKLARQGKPVDIKEHEITIYELLMNDYNTKDNPTIDISVHCSKGTYIRSLAHDIGQKLQVGGFLSTLQRIGIGPISIDQASTLNTITTETIPQKLIQTLPTA